MDKKQILPSGDDKYFKHFFFVYHIDSTFFLFFSFMNNILYICVYSFAKKKSSIEGMNNKHLVIIDLDNNIEWTFQITE